MLEAADGEAEASTEYVPIDHEVAVDWLRSGVDAEQSTLGAFEPVRDPPALPDVEAASTDD